MIGLTCIQPFCRLARAMSVRQNYKHCQWQCHDHERGACLQGCVQTTRDPAHFDRQHSSTNRRLECRIACTLRASAHAAQISGQSTQHLDAFATQVPTDAQVVSHADYRCRTSLRCIASDSRLVMLRQGIVRCVVVLTSSMNLHFSLSFHAVHSRVT